MNGPQDASPANASRTVTVDADQTRYLQKISVGPHLLHADELSDVGGADAGPSAYELLLAALGACIGTTLRMFADRKQWPLQTVHVSLSHRKIPIEESEESDAKSGMVDRIDAGVSLTGNLTEEQRSRLLEIAEKCPVHRTLVSQIQIQTRLTEPSLSPE
jgi:putative redox protein